MAAGGDPGRDAGDGERFGHHHDVDCRVVPGCAGLAQQVEFRGMGEHGLGDERLTSRHERLPRRGGDARRLVGVGLGVVGPPLLGDEVGVDEAGAGEDRGQGEADEGRLAGSVGPDHEVESHVSSSAGGQSRGVVVPSGS